MRINSTQERLLLLGRILDGSLTSLGIALILTVLVRLLNISDETLSIPQVCQGLLGLILFLYGINRKITLYLSKFKENTSQKKLKIIIGFFPFICFTLFLMYRIQLKDIKAYSRLVEEGSLVEWFSFLFLLLAAILFLITGSKEYNKFVSKFVLAIGGLTFFLAMEEVSWGQMIFNWQSPEFFVQSNAQQETNIHNLIFISGEPNTLIISLILSLLTILCLLGWHFRSREKIRLNSISDVIFPPLFLIGYFILGALVYFGLILKMRGIEVPILIPSDQELIECFFALGLLLHSCRIYITWGYNLSSKAK